MLITHFKSLQNKDLSVFVRFREAGTDKRDENTVDLHNLFFLLGSLMLFRESRPTDRTRLFGFGKGKFQFQPGIFPINAAIVALLVMQTLYSL